MSLDVFIIVILAAFIHAMWNALVKTERDQLSVMKTLSLTQLAMSLCLFPFVPVPAAGAWPYLVSSSSVATLYILFLAQAYRSGDLSHAYPLARGSAPLIVVAVSLLFLGETLSLASQLAILFIGVGITSLCLTRGIDGLRNLTMVGYALGAGAFIAAYTLFDGIGVRASGSPHGYIVYVSATTSTLIVLAIHALQRGRPPVVARRTRMVGIVAGIAAYFGAWMVIWAMSRAPVPLVSALRETSIVFAVLLGVIVLKERLDLARVVAIASTLVGAAMLKFSR